MLRVDYVRDPGAAEGVLGMVQYGGAPAASSAGLIHVLLEPAGRSPVWEIWHVEDAVTPFRAGPVQGKVSGQYAFAAVEIADDTGQLLDESVEQAYRDLFHFLEQAGGFQPIRFWNYISDIVADQEGMERYWRFNLGRQRAFAALLRQARPPVATGIGCAGRRTLIYVLGAKSPAEPVENPRQISAFAYPERYGPASPGFSRASRHEGETLFISGTASIVGHETRHLGDVDAQMRETLKNLDVMMRLTEEGGAPNGRWAVKTYLRDIAQAAKLEAALAGLLPSGTQYLHLEADICRRDLLVEIEATRGT
jgi:chorismate lyase/3-hydroxybenzoate synthase